MRRSRQPLAPLGVLLVALSGCASQTSADGALRVVAPSDGTRVERGAIVRVDVEVGQGEWAVVGLSGRHVGLAETLDAPPYTFHLRTPVDTCGSKELQAFARSAGGEIALSDPVRIEIACPTTVDRLEVLAPAMYFELDHEGPTVPLGVLAHVGDAVLHAEELPGIEYLSSDADVAVVDSMGRVEPVGLGTASITVRFADATATARVEVLEPEP